MKRIYTAINLPDAHIVANLLAQIGIRSRVLNANMSSITGELPVDVAAPQVWVEEARDEARARAAVEQFLKPSVGTPRKCPKCGEENPAAFDLCWSCGAGLEGV
jgi:Putative prokaryotic signal transducing protein